ncbi:hypothetical protein PV04_10754 [Phialophora macrospora]|uniref:Uncharacterized protein n=1 Tax=Phialophora macrospora TaxID=1851006 RepID=A0A0D2F3X7_9EURO|nr:hypothetical protein PV04_10754 [Phialophora macrospora]
MQLDFEILEHSGNPFIRLEDKLFSAANARVDGSWTDGALQLADKAYKSGAASNMSTRNDIIRSLPFADLAVGSCRRAGLRGNGTGLEEGRCHGLVMPQVKTFEEIQQVGKLSLVREWWKVGGQHDIDGGCHL